MNGKERYYQREEELSKIGYLAVIFLRKSLEINADKTKKLCETILEDNMEKHDHFEHFDSVKTMIDENLLKMATKRFAYRSFDAPVYWAKKHEEEKRRKALYQPNAKKRFVVKIKK